MKNELDYFLVGDHYGGDQESLPNLIMRMGGCAAVTACDLCVYLSKYKGVKLCNFDTNNFKRSDYIQLTNVMKPYLHPRLAGVNKTKMFIDGFGKYLACWDCDITLSSLEGSEPADVAFATIKSQIDNGIPVPMLVLSHKNLLFKDYVWHWFIINGYNCSNGKMLVKVVSYGKWVWFNFADLWNSGYAKKGGLITIEL